MNRSVRFLIIAVFLVVLKTAQAQPTSGTVNRYAPITAIGFATGATSTNCNNVTLTLGTARGHGSAWAVGDRVLVIQVQGAYPSISNSATFGSVNGSGGGTDGSNGNGLGNAGNFEFNTISAVSGATVNLSSPLQNIYDVAGRVQLVRVPVYANLTLTGNLSGAVWDGSSGGVIALEVTGTLDMSSFNINADAIGFRGGAGVVSAAACGTANWFGNATATTGAEKGEGVAVWNVNYRRARGFWANGGGGGNNREGGGGGGGNGAAGGAGGGQATNACGTNIANGSGLGGAALVPSNTKIFLGGGGGGGHGTGTETPSNGGIGGGIVIASVGNLIGGGRTISANGGNGGDQTVNSANSNTGTGGGGAGGSLYLRLAGTLTGTLNLNANGGRGATTARPATTVAAPAAGEGEGSSASIPVLARLRARPGQQVPARRLGLRARVPAARSTQRLAARSLGQYPPTWCSTPTPLVSPPSKTSPACVPPPVPWAAIFFRRAISAPLPGVAKPSARLPNGPPPGVLGRSPSAIPLLWPQALLTILTRPRARPMASTPS